MLILLLACGAPDAPSAPAPVAASTASAAPASAAPVAAPASAAPVAAPASAAPAAVPLAFPGASLPPEVKVTGTPVDGARWTDTRGENWLVLTRVDGEQRAELRGWLYARGPGGWTMVWDIVDFVRDCEFDITAEFVPGSLRVTDLDQDGEAESAFVYRTACRSDPSPVTQKLLMHEGGTKYALRGRARVELPSMPVDGGEFTPDPAFASAPPAFLDAATRLWGEFRDERP